MKNNNDLEKIDFDDEMPPELDDLTDELNNIRLKQGNVKSDIDTKIKVEAKAFSVKDESVKGGLFKKGFLLRGENKIVKKDENNVMDLTHLKSKPKEEKLILDDVQKNMNKENTLTETLKKKDEWLNQDLLAKIAKNPNLLKYFMDPRFQDAIALMQKDPKKAKDLYGSNPEFNQFFKEFSSIMAEHFKKLSEKNNPLETSLDPEVDAILKDSKIKPILDRMRNEGKIDILEIQKDDYVSKRINILIDKGILKLQKI